MKPLVEEAVALTTSQTLFGELMLQNYTAVILYEQLLRSHSLRWILEIGTATGSLSMFWATWMARCQGRFLTIDNGAAKQWPLRPDSRRVIEQLGGMVLRGDCFVRVNQLKKFIGNDEPGLLFCDGGNKAKELLTFGPSCPRGSVIVAHDYPLEITDDDIAAVKLLKLYEPWNSTSLAGKTMSIVMKPI